MATILDLLKRLHEHGVEFFVIGGVAAVLHGSAHVTVDLDVCAPMTETNFQRIIDALDGLNPKFRMRPDRPPFFREARRLAEFGFRNLNLETDWGILDILGEVPGVGAYAELQESTVETPLGSITVRVLDLATLIKAKYAAKRPKDLRMIPELEFLLRNRNPNSQDGEKPQS